MLGKKVPPTSFTPVTSTNVQSTPRKFLTFRFNPFVTLVGGVMGENYDVTTFILKYLYFKKAWVAILADIIKIVTMIIKVILIDSRKVNS